VLSDRILVMTKSPGTVRHSLAVELGRPRSPRDPQFRELELSITELIMDELGDEE